MKDWRTRLHALIAQAKFAHKKTSRMEKLMVVATALSAVATMITAGIAYMQYQTMEDALVAADRNRTFQSIFEQSDNLCSFLTPEFMGEVRRVGKHRVVILEDLPTLPENYKKDYAEAYRKALLAVDSGLLWVKESHREGLSNIRRSFLRYKPSEAFSDDTITGDIRIPQSGRRTQMAMNMLQCPDRLGLQVWTWVHEGSGSDLVWSPAYMVTRAEYAMSNDQLAERLEKRDLPSLVRSAPSATIQSGDQKVL